MIIRLNIKIVFPILYLSQWGRFCCFNKQPPTSQWRTKLILQQQNNYFSLMLHVNRVLVEALFHIGLTLSPRMKAKALYGILLGCLRTLHWQVSDLKVTPMTSIYSLLAGNIRWPIYHKWTRNFTADPRKQSAKYLKTNTKDLNSCWIALL